MLPKPMPPFFLVKIARKKKEQFGLIIVPDTLKFMAHNMQCGEIIDIGSKAAGIFPEAKIGMTLIIHHFVESIDEHDAKTDHLIHQDETHNYYVVTAMEIPGKRNETYGVFDGEKIIPHKDYIFLQPKKEPKEQLGVTEGGLLVFMNWTESREEKEAKQARLKKETQNLSLSGNHKSHIRQGIAEKEIELNRLSEEMNKQLYKPFTISAKNQSLNISNDATVYALNLAASTEVEFLSEKYIVAPVKYIGWVME